MIGHLTDVTHRPEVKAALFQADAEQIAGYRAEADEAARPYFENHSG